MVGDARVAGAPAGREPRDAPRSPAQSVETAAYTYDSLGRLDTLALNGLTRTDLTWNADGTIASRIDHHPTICQWPRTASVIGLDGSRIATRDGVTTAYLVPDPHGNVAVTETASTAIANAIRYDGYGQTLGTPYQAAGAPY